MHPFLDGPYRPRKPRRGLRVDRAAFGLVLLSGLAVAALLARALL